MSWEVQIMKEKQKYYVVYDGEDSTVYPTVVNDPEGLTFSQAKKECLEYLNGLKKALLYNIRVVKRLKKSDLD